MLELNASFGYLYVVSVRGGAGPFGFIYIYHGKNSSFLWTYLGDA